MTTPSSIDAHRIILSIGPISFSNTFKTNLEAFRDEVEGDYKKFVYYDDTSYHYVRMSADSMRFTEVAHNVFSTSLNVVEQLS